MLPEIEFHKWSDRNNYINELPARATGIGWLTNLKMRMDVHAFVVLANEIPDMEHWNYPKLNPKPISINKFNLPKNYAVICCGFTAPIREFLPNYINEITDYLISKDLTVVFLGQEHTKAGGGAKNITGCMSPEIDFTKGIKLINRTTLLEAAKILSRAKVVIGLDSGLTHLAACSEVPIICGYTSVDPRHRMPVRNNIMGWNFYPVIPPDDQKEKFFQSRIDFEFNIDFTQSYYKNDDLIKSVTPNLYIEQLEKIL